jgi:transcriptional regulator with XRE-family HTH domain
VRPPLVTRDEVDRAKDEALRWQFAKYVAARRKMLGLSQVRLAQRANLPRRMIEYVESGERWPQTPNFFRLCHGLNVKPSVLLEDIGL